jgi:parallel beta-helix repeat protein
MHLRHFVLLSFLILVVSGKPGYPAEGRIPIHEPTTITQPGRYLLTQNISAPSGAAITIEANDVDLDLGGFGITANPSGYCIYSDGYKNISISNGSILSANTGIYLGNTSTEAKFVVHDIRATNTSNIGIEIEGLADQNTEAILYNNIIVREGDGGGQYGIFLNNTRGSLLRDNVVKGFNAGGISLWSCLDALIEGNRVALNSTAVTTTGIGLYYGNGCILRNNIAESNGYGIQVSWSVGNVIASNNASFNRDTGIYFSGVSSNNTVDGNLTANNTEFGIHFDSSTTGNLYSNNRTPGNGTLGIFDENPDDNKNLGNVWWLSGNTGTDPAVDFVGTTDSQPLVLRTAGAERMRLDASGNLGIGTPGPSYRLDVAGDAHVTGAFRDSFGSAGSGGQILSSTGTGTGWITQTPADDGDWTVSGTDMYSAVSGNVGIGAYPSAKLDVNGNVRVQNGALGIETASPMAKLDVHLDSNNYALSGYSTVYAQYNYHADASLDGDGQAALYGYRTHVDQNDGTGYGIWTTNQAISGYNYWGDLFTFGVAGHCFNDFTRTGGVLGAQTSGGYWGALGYKDSGSLTYGGYFTSTGSGTGVHDVVEGIGLGSYGSLMGGWIKGEEYGLFSSGKRFGMFTDGNTYSTGYHGFIQKSDGEKTVAYSIASPSVDVIFHGRARLEAGQSGVAFPPEMQKLISSQSPISVFLSPNAGDTGLYPTNMSRQGFEVARTGGTISPLEFDWMAIGKRAGFENVETPEEILRPDFESNMQQVAFNENDLKGSSLGMYLDNDALRFGAPPESQTPSGKAEVQVTRRSAPADKSSFAVAESRTEGGHPAKVISEPVEASPPVQPPPLNTGTTTLPVAAVVQAGDVLVMIPNDGEALHPCAGEADPMVAGVAVSDEQGGFASVTGGGYVAVKADATLYPISRGDLLVTSPVPGHAMKAIHARMGTIVGKAMEDLAAGTALIRVLVMLR